ncbi:KTSC domain-containing protein [Arcicella aquatica]|uniref:KTSC domain-containing protein n=1 Tax=Arcicella aquatica TaxID=217141 RepID=A0ABU5QRV5_9BACT|nr:KTSC domain-containing protein [Arcicella aquatica]MEA5259832.1 KTSC domain-containing protein [Arcicella aquatica]
MKKINSYRTLFGATKTTELSELKKTYRNLIKEWHPDKIQDNEELQAQAAIKSKVIIEAYNLLVGIAPETHLANAEEYTRITTTSIIEDFDYKDETLKIIFQDNVVYEYFGVPKNTYVKLVNAPSLPRFAKRHIFHSFTYRNVSK